MRRIDALRILVLSVALIFALGGICATHEEDTSDTGEPPSVEAAPPDTDAFNFEWTPPNTDELPTNAYDPPSADAPPPE